MMHGNPLLGLQQPDMRGATSAAQRMPKRSANFPGAGT
jgi:hypothetical protein